MTSPPALPASFASSRAVRPSTLRARRRIFEEARAILLADLSADLRLTTVARRLATSPRQLQRAFAEHSGLSFSEFLVHARMRKAARLLERTDSGVAGVARAVGYGTNGQFSRAFARFHGETPDRYRRAAPASTGRISSQRANRSTERASLPPNASSALTLG